MKTIFLRQKPLQTGLSLMLLAVILCLPVTGLAGSGAQITVGEADGKPGETVEIAVSVKGIAGLEGVDGLTGGEIEIAYDPSAASVDGIRAGELLSNALFVYNEHYSENSVFVTWVTADDLLSGDGILFVINFILKEGGPLAPAVKNVSVSDQFLQFLEVSTPGENGLAEENPSSVSLQPPKDVTPFKPVPDGNGSDDPGEDRDDQGGEGVEDETKTSAGRLPVYLGLGGIVVLAAAGIVFFLGRRRSRFQS